MFLDLNALFFIFYEEKSTAVNSSHTKRVRLSANSNSNSKTKHSKTKRSKTKRSNPKRNNDIIKNLKIKKQVS